MKVHPACAAFPMLSGQEFEELVDDIRQHGQRFPVVMLGDVVLDGRNRLRACEKIGVKPDLEEWDGRGTPAAFVISANIHRRHLTQSQRAMVAADLLPTFKAEAKAKKIDGGKKAGRGRSANGSNGKVGERIPQPIERAQRARDVAAAAAHVNPRYVDHAARIVKEAPAVAAKVRAGELTLPQALRVVEGPSPHQVARNDPSRRWHESMHKLYATLSGVRESGGITEVINGWSKRDRGLWLAEIDRLTSELQSWSKAVRKLVEA